MRRIRIAEITGSTPVRSTIAANFETKLAYQYGIDWIDCAIETSKKQNTTIATHYYLHMELFYSTIFMQCIIPHC